MTTFLKLWERRRSDVYDAYFACAKDADAARPKEYHACVKLQSFFRGYSIRKQLHKEQEAAKNIQRVFRGYMARLSYEERLRRKEKKERMDYFDRNATVIQRIWRGYYSRKNIHSYYRRKAYINGVIQKGAELLVRRKAQQEILEGELKHEKYLVMEAKFKEEASRHHYMVSTRAIPGVFCNTKVAGTADLEHYLRSNRNIKSPSKSPPTIEQETSPQFVFPVIRKDSPTIRNPPMPRLPSSPSTTKVAPLPAIASPTTRRRVVS